jgi:putative ABC transport system permease protein
LYKSQFGVLQLIVLVMVLLSVANSVNMSIFERTGEFGTMMALGNRQSEVFQLIIAESVWLGLTGAGLGLVLGWSLALGISAVGIPMPPPPNANMSYTAHIQVTPMLLMMSCAIGIVATVLAALLPARHVSRMPVVEALRQNF